MRPVDRPLARIGRARPRQWRDILADALAREEAVSVGGCVTSYLHRTPTRAEITAARRASRGLAASGHATIFAQPPGFDGTGSPHLILARPGVMQSGLLGELADAALADKTRFQFEPAAMAQDLATSVELLTAPIQAIPTDRLDQPGTERLLAALDASFEALRQIRRRLRREI